MDESDSIQDDESDPIHDAAEAGDVERVEQLIAQGADVNSRKLNRTPLHVAAQMGHVAVAELLIDHGADIEAKDVFGCTPLYYGVSWGKQEIMDLLMARGAKAMFPVSHLLDLVWGGDRFVMVGQCGLSLTSTDGIEWVAGYTGNGRDMLYSVTWGNGLYVAWGKRMQQGKVERYLLYTSSDGLNWVRRRDPNLENPEIVNVAWFNGRFLAVGLAGLILTSTDGVQWAKQESGITEDLFGTVGGDGQFIVVGRRGTILRSSDASSWTVKWAASEERFNLSSVAWDGQTLVAVGWGNLTGWFSDETAWTVKTWRGEWRYANAVVSAGGRFVAVGGDIALSPDGKKWTFLNAYFPIGDYKHRMSLNNVAAGNGTYVAAGTMGGGSIFTSRDGTNWRGGRKLEFDLRSKFTLPDTWVKFYPKFRFWPTRLRTGD